VLKKNLSLVLKEGAKSLGVELTKISDDQIVRPVMRRSSLEIIREMRAGA
jgi:hypothetical protein